MKRTPDHALAPRKTPRQSRSLDTAEAILRATAHILEREGFEGVTTNRVAEIAGVSIGSLYQYFPNKEALVVAVGERHYDDIRTLLFTRLAAVVGAPLEGVVREVIRAMLAIHAARPKLHAALTERLPRMGLLRRRMDRIEQEIYAPLGIFLASRRDEITVPNPRTAVFVITTAVEAITHAYILETVDKKADVAANEELVEEVTALVYGYLTRPARNDGAKAAIDAKKAPRKRRARP